MNKFAIIGDSTCDLTREMRKQYDIDYCRMRVTLGESLDAKEIYADLDWKDISSKDYFDFLRHGNKVKTTQVTEDEFDLVFGKYLKQGMDVLYISCSSALSASIKLAERLALEKYSKEYPEQKVICVDSLCACMGQGLMLIKASLLRKEGKTIEEVAKYIEENRNHVHQSCTVESLEYLARAGRVKATTAFFGNIFGVKPMVISDAKGNNYACEKVKGRRAALLRVVSMTKENVIDPQNQVCVISHADCKQEDIDFLKMHLMEEIPFKDIMITGLGPIIGGTTGPGTITTYCWGKEITIVGE